MSAREALVETFAYYKYEVTRFEADLWSRMIDEYGDDAVIAFLQSHLRASQFAPKISDAQRLLCPDKADEDAAFVRLTQAVRRSGPYAAPRLEDPALALAVVNLGGWAAVNAQLPTPEARFDYEAFHRRFAAAYRSALSDIALRRAPRVELRGLHASSAPEIAEGNREAAVIVARPQGRGEA